MFQKSALTFVAILQRINGQLQNLKNLNMPQEYKIELKVNVRKEKYDYSLDLGCDFVLVMLFFYQGR